jgi:kinetochore protein Mis12/MTW1
LCDDITEAARFEIYTTIGGIEGWTTSMAEGKGEAYEREVDMVRGASRGSIGICEGCRGLRADGVLKGLHSIETLLESHVDKAFDRFTAWALRNTFDIPSDVEAVLVGLLFHSPTAIPLRQTC